MAPTDRSLTFAPLRVRSFRFQFPADLLTSWAFEMETLILGWYVMVTTGSVLLLTLFGSLQLLGTLVAPMFGVLGDRLGSRAMLCSLRAAFAVLAALLMTLSFADLLTPVWVLIVAALAGVVRPNDQAMRNALIGDTIPREHLMGALGMSRTTADSARVAGALAGASVSASLGIGLAYVFVTALYLASLALTLGVARAHPIAVPGGRDGAPIGLPRASGWREMVDGLVYVWTRPKMLGVMWLAFLVNLTAYPISGGLMPYVARNVYGTGATGLGSLVAGYSFGALLGSIGMVLSGGPRHAERSMIVFAALWYASLLAFAHVSSMPVGIAVLVVTGVVQSVAMISLAASLLNDAEERFRGRVMGVRMLAVYGMPIGLMAAGALIDRIGFAGTATLYGLIGLAFTAAIGARWRASLWHAHDLARPSTQPVPRS
jgi:MFS family permease